MPSSTKIALIVFLAAFGLSAAMPIPDKNTQANNAYSGPGGDASGGSVYNDHKKPNALGGVELLNFLSNNGGNAGAANSGPSSGRSGSKHALSQAHSGTGNGGVGATNDSVGNSYSGAGGSADGGSVKTSGGLINVMSNNAGSGGSASSGSSGPLSALRGPNNRVTKTTKTTKFSRIIHLRLD